MADPTTFLKANLSNPWLVSLKVLRSAMEQLGHPQGTWISLETLKLASRYLDQLWKTWVSLKVLGSAMTDLSVPWLI
jgi:hypothetical protein